jgi:hypothetical protein
VFGLKLSGFIAWLMWRGLYLLRIPTLARKTRLLLEWNWAMFFPPDIAHLLGYRRTQRHGAQALSSTQPSAPATNPVPNGRAAGKAPTGCDVALFDRYAQRCIQ